MPVALLPPITSSGPQSWGTPEKKTPITSAERYARCRGMSRWHRIRSGYQVEDGARTFNLWCGTFVSDRNAKAGPPLLADDIGNDDVCAICVGKALGAGQDELPAGMPRLRFDPRWSTPPAVCPGSGDSGLWVPVPNSRNVVRCLACGLVLSGRASGGAYNPRWGAVRHAPGEGLVEPCPFHAWNHLRRGDGEQVSCGCGWPS
ncbi:hypothetical protein FHR83_006636 [Actinoplanes campanulatus]|uniref:Uncharacterized protein n=1 Tax=Actinoplanes campanulatus TaxID=113559 RepID=A0A7W5AMR6_9ACTN|nr:hypothetical protein [Actinoplanes campanulatus]MBB3098930.1 hypothetical protein [Actinoplanes campanulatus]GGN39806.1 hypothetical protein GCM10010109_68200 [Actinoplanes campanulatus]GID40134.1 hypothetical protein Aca09nite_66400 [Actinoplanes campanulatus]